MLYILTQCAVHIYIYSNFTCLYTILKTCGVYKKPWKMLKKIVKEKHYTQSHTWNVSTRLRHRRVARLWYLQLFSDGDTSLELDHDIKFRLCYFRFNVALSQKETGYVYGRIDCGNIWIRFIFPTDVDYRQDLEQGWKSAMQHTYGMHILAEYKTSVCNLHTGFSNAKFTWELVVLMNKYSHRKLCSKQCCYHNILLEYFDYR